MSTVGETFAYRVLERDIIRGIMVLEIEYPRGVYRKVYRYLDEKPPKRTDSWEFRICAKWCRCQDWHVQLARYCLTEDMVGV